VLDFFDFSLLFKFTFLGIVIHLSFNFLLWLLGVRKEPF
jgi:hypothetical protein